MKAIHFGQHAQIEKGDGIEALCKELTHIEFGDQKRMVVQDAILLGKLADQFLGVCLAARS